jgi:flagellar motor protein MotB
MNGLDESHSHTPPIWAIFGDLMSGLVGVFVLLLVWTLGFQVELSMSLKDEIAKREMEEQRRIELENALADPLAQGRISLHDHRIGISGSILFSLNSAKLQPEGRELLRSLVNPLRVYLDQSDEFLMISGFTDNLPVHEDNRNFTDNWDLSAQRALTVTRALIEEGMPDTLVFAAAFGEHQPVYSNEDETGREKNRRVEIAPVSRSYKSGATP